MTSVAFDTHTFVKRLKSAGLPEEQAEIITEAINIARNVDFSHLATKDDLHQFATKDDLHREIRELEIRMMKWGFAMLAGQGALIVALLKLL